MTVFNVVQLLNWKSRVSLPEQKKKKKNILVFWSVCHPTVWPVSAVFVREAFGFFPLSRIKSYKVKEGATPIICLHDLFP